MRKYLLLIPTALMVASFVPGVARAADETPENCIEGCNNDFPGSSPEEVAIRGWCYILRGCWL